MAVISQQILFQQQLPIARITQLVSSSKASIAQPRAVLMKAFVDVLKPLQVLQCCRKTIANENRRLDSRQCFSVQVAVGSGGVDFLQEIGKGERRRPAVRESFDRSCKQQRQKLQARA